MWDSRSRRRGTSPSSHRCTTSPTGWRWRPTCCPTRSTALKLDRSTLTGSTVGVAQLVELRVVVPAVASSNLVAHPSKTPCKTPVFAATRIARSRDPDDEEDDEPPTARRLDT